jgi:hypothetical protein
MNLKKVVSILFLALLMVGAYAQEHSATIKVVDLKDVTTIVSSASSSSSSSCNSPDFPVLRGGSYTDVNFNDLRRITVLHDRPVQEGSPYIKIELTGNTGESEVLEMIKTIRFSGKTKEGMFSIMVEEIKTVEVIE